MWPFKKKEPKPDRTGETIAKLKSFKDIGETFNYLGRTCVVTGHWEYWPYCGVVPMLKFDYADEHGILHSVSANIRELPALINQQTPNVKVRG